MKILKRREHHDEVEYRLFFSYKDMPSAGFSFDCDENGFVEVEKLAPGVRESYEKCLTGRRQVHDPPKIVRHHHRWVEPAVGECVCGAEVELYGFTNTCDRCHRDYNMSGQMLCPRELWGEETFETVSDILAIDGMSTDRLLDD